MLRGHCDREGRDYDEIAKTILWSGRIDPSDGAGFARVLAGFAELGVTEVHVMHRVTSRSTSCRRSGARSCPAIHDL